MKILTVRAEVCGDICMQGLEAEAEMDDGMYIHVTYAYGTHFSVTEYSIFPDVCPAQVEFVEVYEDDDEYDDEDEDDEELTAREEARKSKYGKVFELLANILDNLDTDI